MPLRDTQKTRRPRLAPPPRTAAALSLAALLLAAACSQNDPRYPVYFRYAVDVKVDGVPVTIERVVKCTGTRSWNTSADPGGWSGKVYANPPVIGAKVPGSDAAVYVQTPDACRWTAEYEGHAWKNPPLEPGDLVPVLWTDNWRRLEQIEYYPTRSSLAGEDSHVEFVRIQPMTRTDRRAFKASEKRAATESPDLRPFASVKAKGFDGLTVDPSWLNPGRAKGGLPYVRCQSALILGHIQWNDWPQLSQWVDSLPDGASFHPIAPVLKNLSKNIYQSTFNGAVSFRFREYLGRRYNKKQLRKDSIDELIADMRPITHGSDGVFIDNTRKGIMSCVFERWHFENSFAYASRHAPLHEGSSVDKIYIVKGYNYDQVGVIKSINSIVYFLERPPFSGRSSEPVAMDTIN